MEQATASPSRRWPLKLGRLTVRCLFAVIGVTLVACGLWVAANTIEAVIATHSYMLQDDEWDVMQKYLAFKAGRLNAFTFFWEQHNEHRVVVARLLFILDERFAAGTQILTKSITLVLSGGLVGFFASEVMTLKRIPVGVRCASAGLFLALFLSSQNMENFDRGFNNQVLTVVFFSVLALYFVDRSINAAERGHVGKRKIVLLFCSIVAAILATYSMANGVLVWPTMVLLCVWHKQRKKAAIIGLFGLIIIASYFGGVTRGSADPTAVLVHPFDALRFFLAFMATPFGSFNIWEATAVGAIVMIPTTYYFVREWALGGKSKLAWLMLAICLVTIGTGALVMFGRLGFGVEHALSPRYASYVTPLWAATLMLGLIHVTEASRPSRWWWLDGVMLCLTLALCGSVFFFAQSWGADWAKIKFARYERAATAIVARAPDRGGLDLAGSNPDAILGSIDYLSSRRLSIFHSTIDDRLYRMMGADLGKPLSTFRPLGGNWCVGYIDEFRDTKLLPQAKGEWTFVSGWAMDMQRSEKVDAVFFVDEEGRLVGVGRILFPRSDVARIRKLKDPELTVHFLGYANLGKGREVQGYAYLADRNELCRFDVKRI